MNVHILNACSIVIREERMLPAGKDVCLLLAPEQNLQLLVVACDSLIRKVCVHTYDGINACLLSQPA